MQVVLTLDPGGTERLVIDMTRALASSVQSVVCCLEGPGAWTAELASLDVPVIALNREPGFKPGLGLQIARSATEHSVDVLHCHHYSPFVYGQIGSLAGKRWPVVFTEHGRLSDAPPSTKRRFVNPLLGRLPAAVFAVSADLKRHMIREGWPQHRVHVIHNGIDPGDCPTPAERHAARTQWDLSPQHFVVGTVGRLDPVKDLSTLLESFALLQRLHPQSRLVIAGDGPDRAALEARAKALGLEAYVTFAGYRRDARALLPAFDVYANSSIHEGVSLTILEAMAAQLPVVATRVGGTPEVVLDEEVGLLVAPGSPEALAGAFERLLRGPERLAEMGRAARLRVQRHFSMDMMVNRYLDAYRAALSR